MRFYVSPGSIFPDRNTIEVKDKNEIRHIRDVMRLEKGVVINVFDGEGREFSGNIDIIDRDRVIIKIKKAVDSSPAPSFSVTLYQAIPKKTKMDFIVEKSVELGVDNIAPMITDRTVPDIRGNESKKTERWRRIATAASKQCGRSRLPGLSGIMNFSGALAEAKGHDLAIFACLDEDSRPLREALTLTSSRPHNIAIFVGPEGDFSPREISMARTNGFKICSLGHLVLRSETAAIYVLSCLRYEYGA